MSAEVVNALNNRAAELETEAKESETSSNHLTQRHPLVLNAIADEFRRLAHEIQGFGGSQDSAAASSGLSVHQTGPGTVATGGVQVEQLNVDPTAAPGAGAASS
jgi:hypothetical protein